MAELEQVFEDTGEAAKKLFKNKWFLIAAVGVGVVAIYAAWRKNQTVDDTAYEAVGYAGYPTVSGGADSSVMDYSAMDYSYLESLMEEINAGNSVNVGEYESAIDDLTEELHVVREESKTALSALERSQAITQMRANSELYNNISDPDIQKALHEENLAIAEKFGWVFGEGGNYYEGNSVVYTTTRQTVEAMNQKTATPAAVTFENNVDYQQKINEAILSGASAETINQLNAQRNAKIAATGVTNPNQSYDANFDYAAAVAKAREIGVDDSVIKNLQEQRFNKAKASGG